MTAILPPDSSFRLRQIPGKWQRKTLLAQDHVAILMPAKVPASLWDDLPEELRGLRAVERRLGETGRSKWISGHLPASTRVTLARMPAAPRGGGRLSAAALLKFAGDLAAEILRDQAVNVAILVFGMDSAERRSALDALLLALTARNWQPPQFRANMQTPSLKTVTLAGLEKKLDFSRTLIEGEAANLARWLTAMPPNKLDAASYRELLGELAGQHDWELTFFDEPALHKLGAGAFLAVAQGNASRDAGIARLRYRPDASAGHPDLALVGKGIIFDTGGTNLKPFSSMLDMHEDMAGSAVALALLMALTRLKVPLATDCWLALTENRTGPLAYKSRDVVTACNGVTIEVIHTDAEGRMALADTLALAAREKPGLIADFATLTGTCVHALSERYSGVFSNREPLLQLLVSAGRNSGERLWPFPLDDDFDTDLESQVADVLQCAVDAKGDHILASRFLQRFVPQEIPWIHMDLSAASRKQGLGQMPPGATGFGVRCMLALLIDQADQLQAAVRHD